MDNKEIILAKIAEIISRSGFFIKGNSEFKARLKCVGLGEYFEKYSEYLIPYYYHDGYSRKFENDNEEYDVFFGLDGIFTDLYHWSIIPLGICLPMWLIIWVVSATSPPLAVMLHE